VSWAVDCSSGDTFLYSYITNISAMGIFIYSEKPLAAGAPLALKFAPPGEEPFELEGEVAWVNPYHPDGENINPGMGVRFVNLTPEIRERLVDLVRTIAYLPDQT
jgi:type IV pilus assembly protein PilZ